MFRRKQSQYRQFAMDADSSIDRQLTSCQTARDMSRWGLSTHFNYGYTPPSFRSETHDLFAGRRKDSDREFIFYTVTDGFVLLTRKPQTTLHQVCSRPAIFVARRLSIRPRQ